MSESYNFTEELRRQLDDAFSGKPLSPQEEYELYAGLVDMKTESTPTKAATPNDFPVAESLDEIQMQQTAYFRACDQTPPTIEEEFKRLDRALLDLALYFILSDSEEKIVSESAQDNCAPLGLNR